MTNSTAQIEHIGMRSFQKIYHRLPSFFWQFFASLQAYRLKRRRYGKIFKHALPAINERLQWEHSKWEAFQKKQLTETLDRASKMVPAYRGNPSPRRLSGTDPLDILRDWPLIDRDFFRRNADQFRDPEYGYKNCIELFTSGTTGTPKKIIRDARAEQLNYAYTEARWRNTAGVQLHDRWVMIGGQLVVPVERERPPFCVPAYPMQQLYASSYHLRPEFAEAYMRAIKNWAPVYMYGYASSLNLLAQFAELTNTPLHLKCIISNAEPLYEHVRLRLEKVFQCRVYDTYGGTEGAFMGFECSSGRMHLCPDFGVMEIVREDGTPCEPGESGNVVVTGLTNRAMPLIRYPNGDTAAWAKDQRCRCGCSFPVIERIEGRTDDLIELPDGRVVGRLDPVFKSEFPIREAQIIQKNDLSIRVLIVKDPPRQHDGNSTSGEEWTAIYERDLLKELRARLGNAIPISVHYVDHIPRGPNNKFKAVIRER
jgi:phenylacetate-CoA ligase